jgi:hypothetical protein
MAAHGGMMRGPITLALPHHTTMDPALPVQAQLDAYNARDLERFVACYADDVQLYRPPAAEPVLQGKAAMAAHYAAHRFKLPLLHAELVNRMVLGNKVIDHERITGLAAQPVEAAVVFEVNAGLIDKVWFFNAA